MTRPDLSAVDIDHHDGRWCSEHWVFHLRTPRARKPYTCNACCELIETGLRHVKYVTANLEGPGMETWRIHGECYIGNIAMFYGERPTWRWDPS